MAFQRKHFEVAGNGEKRGRTGVQCLAFLCSTDWSLPICEQQRLVKLGGGKLHLRLLSLCQYASHRASTSKCFKSGTLVLFQGKHLSQSCLLMWFRV